MKKPANTYDLYAIDFNFCDSSAKYFWFTTAFFRSCISVKLILMELHCTSVSNAMLNQILCVVGKYIVGVGVSSMVVFDFPNDLLYSSV